MFTDEIELPAKVTCLSCGSLIEINCKHCNLCGAKQFASETNSVENKWLLFKQGAVFYALYIIICSLSNFIDYFQTFRWLLFVKAALAIIPVAFFLYGWKENKKLLVWPNFSWQKLAGYGALAMIASVLVHYSVGWLNTTIFPKQEHYYYLLKGDLFAEFLLVFFTAVTPALFEELGFRGYLLQALLNVADTEQAIYISAFLFAIIHFSIISLFWLIPFALWLGFIRVKEQTLWYGIFIHFCFNLTACLFQLL